ncbi:hypothetical protein ABZ891_24845 [Streptomyces sp. NPDC047023]|uniref:hypothetical protein n=1 Tax=Streptomyces sp. NPDC047023 TaxID=3155139 RepID=UPI0033E9FC67
MLWHIHASPYLLAGSVEQFTGPSPWTVSLAVTFGVLAALVFGMLHRADAPLPPAPAPRPFQDAFMRGGQAFFGATALGMTTLLASPHSASVLIALVAVVCGVVYGRLAHGGCSLGEAVWKAAKAFASVGTVCHAFLALYSQR